MLVVDISWPAVNIAPSDRCTVVAFLASCLTKNPAPSTCERFLEAVPLARNFVASGEFFYVVYGFGMEKSLVWSG
jgi:hypothetical protein